MVWVYGGQSEGGVGVGSVAAAVAGTLHLLTAGELAFGTVDSFLLWRLSEGQTHATDATNASRTLLFNIHTQHWDGELLDLFVSPAR